MHIHRVLQIAHVLLCMSMADNPGSAMSTLTATAGCTSEVFLKDHMNLKHVATYLL